MKENNLTVIATISNDFKEKFGIPRQSGLVETPSRIVFEPQFRDPEALRGIEGFDWLWLIWGFSENRERPYTATVRPPRLGGQERMGVFATRSPYRPNGLGLSSVRLLGTEHTAKGTVLLVSGADLLDGTPIYDIKPYLPYTDAHQGRGGWSDGVAHGDNIPVEFPETLRNQIPEDQLQNIIDLLRQDPRPGYDYAQERTFSMRYGDYDLRFRVDAEGIHVTDIH